MAMMPDQLRAALRDLNGQRDVRLEFENAQTCVIEKALLVPAEVTDGAREFVVDGERIAWIKIG